VDRDEAMRVLVVEKDVSLGDSIKAFLQDWGHEAQHCTRGKDAVGLFKAGFHDLVIMEVMLPDIKGEHLISKLKEISPDARIVAMTGNNSRELEARIRERGILYYMVKPFETDNLRSLLEHLSRRYAKPPAWAEWRNSS
jgi:DNA-binding response OmpR family regulator